MQESLVSILIDKYQLNAVKRYLKTIEAEDDTIYYWEFTGYNVTRFVRYNVFQSIFISLLYFVLSFGFGLILKFLSYIPFLNYLVATITFQFNRPVLFDYSLIQVFMIGLTIYMAMISLLGRRPRVFWVSRIIDNSVR